MFVDEDKKVIFIHNPKTAGSSMELFFRGRGYFRNFDQKKRHWDLSDYQRFLNITNLNDYYIFGTVRNPWERAYSLWKFKLTKTRWQKRLKRNSWCDDIRNTSDFNDWVLYPKNFNDGTIWGWKKNQIELFKSLSNIYKYNRILRFENLEDDWKGLLNDLEIPYWDLPFINVNSKKSIDYRDIYNEKAKLHVENFYQKDIDYFGYKF